MSCPACGRQLNARASGTAVFLSFGLIVNAILLAGGIYWCYEIFGRWRSDVAELREGDDKTTKGVIIGFWMVTVVVAVLVFNFAWGVVAGIISGIRSL
jgi:hypothetical protein